MALGATGPAAREALRAGMGGEMALNYKWAVEQIEGRPAALDQ